MSMMKNAAIGALVGVGIVGSVALVVATLGGGLPVVIAGWAAAIGGTGVGFAIGGGAVGVVGGCALAGAGIGKVVELRSNNKVNSYESSVQPDSQSQSQRVVRLGREIERDEKCFTVAPSRSWSHTVMSMLRGVEPQQFSPSNSLELKQSTDSLTSPLLPKDSSTDMTRSQSLESIPTSYQSTDNFRPGSWR